MPVCVRVCKTVDVEHAYLLALTIYSNIKYVSKLNNLIADRRSFLGVPTATDLRL